MSITDPQPLTKNLGDTRYNKTDSPQITEHHFSLGNFTAAGTSDSPVPSHAMYVNTGSSMPLVARIPTSCELIRTTLSVSTTIPANDTNYWWFYIRRVRPNGQPMFSTTTYTNTVITSAKTTVTAGHAMNVLIPFPMFWVAWDRDAAQLREDDALTIYIEPHGTPAVQIDRLAVSISLKEVT